MCCSAFELIGRCVREALPCLPAVYGFITVMCSTGPSVFTGSRTFCKPLVPHHRERI
jgi:hypothetical protein